LENDSELKEERTLSTKCMDRTRETKHVRGGKEDQEEKSLEGGESNNDVKGWG